MLAGSVPTANAITAARPNPINHQRRRDETGAAGAGRSGTRRCAMSQRQAGVDEARGAVASIVAASTFTPYCCCRLASQTTRTSNGAASRRKRSPGRRSTLVAQRAAESGLAPGSIDEHDERFAAAGGPARGRAPSPAVRPGASTRGRRSSVRRGLHAWRHRRDRQHQHEIEQGDDHEAARRVNEVALARARPASQSRS